MRAGHIQLFRCVSEGIGVGCFAVARFHRRGPILKEDCCRNLNALLCAQSSPGPINRVPEVQQSASSLFHVPCTRVLVRSLVLVECRLRLLHVARAFIPQIPRCCLLAYLPSLIASTTPVSAVELFRYSSIYTKTYVLISNIYNIGSYQSGMTPRHGKREKGCLVCVM